MASASNTKKGNTARTSGKGSSGSTKRKRKKTRQNLLLAEILMMVIIAVSVLMILANFGLCGKAGAVLQKTTFGLFGILGYITPVLWIVFGFIILTNPGNTYKKIKILMAFVFLICLCGICQMIFATDFVFTMTGKDYFLESLEKKSGGGFFGGVVVKFLYPVFSSAGTWIVLILLAVIQIVLITEFSVVDFIKYILEDFGDSYKENKEIREIKSERNRVLREAQIEENRRKNGEKMLRARKDLERVKNDAAKGRKNQKGDSYIDNPLKDVIEKKEYQNDKSSSFENQNKDSGSVKKSSKASRTRIPSFLMNGESGEEENTDDSLDEIINRELEKNSSAQSDFSLDDVQKVSHTSQMKMSDYPEMIISPSQEEKTDEEQKYYKDGFPVRKKIERETGDTTRVIEAAGGKVIVSSTGTGGTKPVDEVSSQDEEKKRAEEISEPEREYVFPPVKLLGRGVSGPKGNIDRELKDTARKLQQTLQNFGVKVNITNVSCGPAVTRYELQPEMGVKVSKILSLQDDIKLNLAAPDIRIEAPIPGKAAIGIEVPNKENVSVSMREIIESDGFRNNPSKLAFACGKDIGGQVVIGDISKMTHLLIAGATGSGKSVCINTIIMSILYHAKPSEVKLLMIDPKVVELSVYNGIPHLLRPVVTDAKQAAALLSWAVSEMTERYNRFAEAGVRNISGYNAKIKEQFKGRENEMPKLMPQIVIIVDELADLMMVAANEVEDSILHLAQMARAAGMHLILATQRPSVNVITGVIKANIPSRIAFAVSSGVDSRTILDMVGAEKLLGKGDMLYYPSGMQKPIRVQGAFVSDKEVSAVVDFLAGQGNVLGGGYDQKIDLTAVAAMTDSKSSLSAELGNGDKDPLFKEAGMLIVSTQKASIGSLQRKFRIGFNRAARIMDQLCEAGAVGEEVGTKPREVLMSADEFEEYCSENL